VASWVPQARGRQAVVAAVQLIVGRHVGDRVALMLVLDSGVSFPRMSVRTGKIELKIKGSFFRTEPRGTVQDPLIRYRGRAKACSTEVTIPVSTAPTFANAREALTMVPAGRRLAGPSLPLDVGRSADIPAAIRRAVTLRDQHCQWAGGCDQPAAACEVHHVVHLADGGSTSVRACGLYCFFHHHVAVHKWGWTVTLNPDGTTTARSPDGTKILHSHGPPPRHG
jgi:hypothetical protein